MASLISFRFKISKCIKQRPFRDLLIQDNVLWYKQDNILW